MSKFSNFIDSTSTTPTEAALSSGRGYATYLLKLFLLDLTDRIKYIRRYRRTQSNKLVLEFLTYLSQSGDPIAELHEVNLDILFDFSHFLEQTRESISEDFSSGKSTKTYQSITEKLESISGALSSLLADIERDESYVKTIQNYLSKKSGSFKPFTIPKEQSEQTPPAAKSFGEGEKDFGFNLSSLFSEEGDSSPDISISEPELFTSAATQTASEPLPSLTNSTIFLNSLSKKVDQLVAAQKKPSVISAIFKKISRSANPVSELDTLSFIPEFIDFKTFVKSLDELDGESVSDDIVSTTAEHLSSIIEELLAEKDFADSLSAYAPSTVAPEVLKVSEDIFSELGLKEPENLEDAPLPSISEAAMDAFAQDLEDAFEPHSGKPAEAADEPFGEDYKSFMSDVLVKVLDQIPMSNSSARECIIGLFDSDDLSAAIEKSKIGCLKEFEEFVRGAFEKGISTESLSGHTDDIVSELTELLTQHFAEKSEPEKQTTDQPLLYADNELDEAIGLLEIPSEETQDKHIEFAKDVLKEVKAKLTDNTAATNLLTSILNDPDIISSLLGTSISCLTSFGSLIETSKQNSASIDFLKDNFSEIVDTLADDLPLELSKKEQPATKQTLFVDDEPLNTDEISRDFSSATDFSLSSLYEDIPAESALADSVIIEEPALPETSGLENFDDLIIQEQFDTQVEGLEEPESQSLDELLSQDALASDGNELLDDQLISSPLELDDTAAFLEGLDAQSETDQIEHPETPAKTETEEITSELPEPQELPDLLSLVSSFDESPEADFSPNEDSSGELTGEASLTDSMFLDESLLSEDDLKEEEGLSDDFADLTLPESNAIERIEDEAILSEPLSDDTSLQNELLQLDTEEPISSEKLPEIEENFLFDESLMLDDSELGLADGGEALAEPFQEALDLPKEKPIDDIGAESLDETLLLEDDLLLDENILGTEAPSIEETTENEILLDKPEEEKFTSDIAENLDEPFLLDEFSDQPEAFEETSSTPEGFEPDEIQQIFLEEADEHLERLNADLLELDKLTGSYQPDLVNRILRSSHTIKGSAAMVQLNNISDLAHKMEDSLQIVRDQNLKVPASLVDVLFQSVDAITNMLTQFRQTGSDFHPSQARLMETLESCSKQLSETGTFADAAPQPQPQPQPASRFQPNEIQQIFLEEADEHLERLNADLLELDKLTGSYQPDLVNRILRSSHTIKGSAAMVQLNNISDLAHKMEDSLQIVRDQNLKVPASLVDVLFQSVDAITNMLTQFRQTGSDFHPSQARLMETLESCSKQLSETGTFADAAPQPQPQPQPASRFQPNEIQQIFLDEAGEYLEKLSSDLLELDKLAGSYQPDLVNRILRSSHTIKGSAAMVQLNNISDLAHKMEDSLQIVRDQNLKVPASLVDILFQSVDAITNMLTQFRQTGSDDAPNQSLLDILSSYADQLLESGEINKPVTVGPDKSGSVRYKQEDTPQPTPAQQIQQTSGPVAEQTVRIDIEALNNLVNLSAELVIARTRLNNELSSVGKLISKFSKEKASLEGIGKKINENVQKSNEPQQQAKPAAKSFGGQQFSADDPLNPLFSDLLKEFSEGEFDRFNEFDIISRHVKSSTLNFDDAIKELRDLTSDLNQNIVKVSTIANDLNREIVGMRMVPVKQMFIRFSRSVRDIARSENKLINFITEGEDTKLDKMVMEEVIEPMMHIVRNSIGHGIETPEKRRSKNKNDVGKLILRAYQKGNRVILEVEDDGAGISVDRVRQKALEKGLLSPEKAEKMTPEAATELIFRPGFSTAEKVTELHGRGVGLDVVHSTIRSLKGFVKVESKEGQGTKFIISLPLTLAISDALLVELLGNIYAIPLESIYETLTIPSETIEIEDGKRYIKTRYDRIELHYLNDLLGFDSDLLHFKAMLPVTVIDYDNKRIAVAVEKLIGKEEIVVKTLGSHLRNVRGVIGATILGDGRVVIILDMNYLLRPLEARERDFYITIESKPEEALPAKAEEHPSMLTKRRRKGERITVLAADDSPSVRKYIQSVLDQAGIDVVSVDDGINALNKLPTSNCDIILTDLEMPRMNGLELVSEIRKMPEYADIPIVIVTARAGEKHRRKGLELGANAFLNKPFDPKALVETIENFIA